MAAWQQTGISITDVQYGQKTRSTLFPEYEFIQLKLEDRDALLQLCKDEKFDAVCHLAAQAGVRYSLTNPYAYVSANLEGFINMLEACRHSSVGHLAVCQFIQRVRTQHEYAFFNA